MKVRYLVEVEMKEGEDAPTCDRVRTAIYGCGKQCDSIRNITVGREAVKNNVFGVDLYGLAQNMGETWLIEDFYNSHKKAENAVHRAKENVPAGEFAVFQYNHNTSVWEKC